MHTNCSTCHSDYDIHAICKYNSPIKLEHGTVWKVGSGSADPDPRKGYRILIPYGTLCTWCYFAFIKTCTPKGVHWKEKSAQPKPLALSTCMGDGTVFVYLWHCNRLRHCSRHTDPKLGLGNRPWAPHWKKRHPLLLNKWSKNVQTNIASDSSTYIRATKLDPDPGIKIIIQIAIFTHLRITEKFEMEANGSAETIVVDPDLYVFGPPGSRSGSVIICTVRIVLLSMTSFWLLFLKTDSNN